MSNKSSAQIGASEPKNYTPGSLKNNSKVAHLIGELVTRWSLAVTLFNDADDLCEWLKPRACSFNIGRNY